MIREFLEDRIYFPIYRCVSRAKWWVLWRFHPRHRYNVVKTGLPPGYYDAPEAMLHACFSLLKDYVEIEHEGAEALARHIDMLVQECLDDNLMVGSLDRQIEIEREALNLYLWWTRERPKDEKLYDELLDAVYRQPRLIERSTSWVEGVPVVQTDLREDNEEEAELRPWLDAMDKKIREDEDRNLERLMNIRRGLWT